MNAGTLMNPKPFLDSVYSKGMSLCAWLWKYDIKDQDALLNSLGFSNDINNNNWGSTFRTFCLQPRKNDFNRVI